MDALPEPVACRECGSLLRDEFEGLVCPYCKTVIRWTSDIRYPEPEGVIDL